MTITQKLHCLMSKIYVNEVKYFSLLVGTWKAELFVALLRKVLEFEVF